jgi:hypothetical protein
MSTNTPTPDLIRTLASRFCAWPLPRDFAPDGGCTFAPPANPNHPWPVGTNLLTVSQAEEMLRFVLDDATVEQSSKVHDHQRTSTPVGVGETRYLITKGGAYYRPKAQGYTRDKSEAGRYTLTEAIRHSHPNGPDGPRDGIAYELAPAGEHQTPPDWAIAEAHGDYEAVYMQGELKWAEVCDQQVQQIESLVTKLSIAQEALEAIQSEAQREGSLDHHLRRCAIVQTTQALAQLAK